MPLNGELVIIEIVQWDDDHDMSTPLAGCRGCREVDFHPTCGNSIVPMGSLPARSSDPTDEKQQ